MISLHPLMRMVSRWQGPWWVWYSKDLVDWEMRSQLSSFPWEPAGLQHEQWATDAAERNGTYYWYLSLGGDNVGVAVGSSPLGPWTDPLGRALLPESLGKSLDPPTCIRDPGVLQDDDGQYYIVFGACSGPTQPTDSCYYAAELHEVECAHR